MGLLFGAPGVVDPARMREATPRFPGLNALRFFAAYFVVLHHAEQARAKNGLANLKGFAAFNSGGFAVTFFFVLSGFLITYLLLFERETTGRVHVFHFYVRRALRIWPLYFLMVAIGLYVVPPAVQMLHLHYKIPYRASDVLPLFLVFAPFVVNLRYEPHLLEPLWSIGVEEVFYLGWAPLFALFQKRLLVLLLGVIAVKAAALGVVQGLDSKSDAARLVRMLQFEAMAVGGLGAHWLRRRHGAPLPRALFSRPTEAVLLALLFSQMTARVFLSRHVPGYDVLFGGGELAHFMRLFLFLWLILDVSSNSDPLLGLRSPVLDRLGEISYGVYMYHMLIATAVTLALKPVLARLDLVTSTLIFYAAVSAGTIFVAEISKRWFEDPFLRLKKRFAP